MEQDRLELHAILQTTLPGIPLYFRPSSTLVMTYPCVVYDVEELTATHANNIFYAGGTRFKVTYICPLPGDDNPSVILRNIPGAKHTSSFLSDDLTHDVFRIFINVI